MSKIIVIEDDIYLREELVNTFVKKGYSVSSISSFDTPEKEILDSNPDLAVLDLNLPGKSGFELCKWLKARASFPILILTSRDALGDELFALGLGADDYLTKPCHPDRLIARVERLLQTYGKVRSLVQARDLVLDLDTYKVIWKNAYVVLSETEGKILQVLIEQHPSVVSKQTLSLVLWGGNEYVDENILQVNMTRLRKSLDAIGLRDMIQTVRGQGYRLEVSKP
ncbi:response regulator transcription factor [Dehalobacterium formicoaceticum]|uniref:Stage 0 sporulation protein A homolog n=1 Tax=Dehalobacterium formicoaceticum TaxID=51515 RepID=A0ABT1Y6G3_9FIRM|nr:response regulator transcription factor [Dehalobacterium formicoaceticum]MCR6546478.1 response regulator transcription factor [Dehalobacterium formicoaceticum]